MMNPEEVMQVLSNESRVEVLQLLSSKPKTATEAHEEYLKTHDDSKHRETVYRYLETLVDAGIVEKNYQRDRGLVYSIPNRRLLLDLERWTVEPADSVNDPDHDRT